MDPNALHYDILESAIAKVSGSAQCASPVLGDAADRLLG